MSSRTRPKSLLREGLKIVSENTRKSTQNRPESLVTEGQKLFSPKPGLKRRQKVLHHKAKRLLTEDQNILSQKKKEFQSEKAKRSPNKTSEVLLTEGQKVFSQKAKQFYSREAKRTKKTRKDMKVLSQKIIRYALRRSAVFLPGRQKIISQKTKFFSEKRRKASQKKGPKGLLTESQKQTSQQVRRYYPNLVLAGADIDSHIHVPPILLLFDNIVSVDRITPSENMRSL